VLRWGGQGEVGGVRGGGGGGGGGEVEKLLVVLATETGDKRLPGGPLGSYAHFTFNLFKACHTILKM